MVTIGLLAMPKWAPGHAHFSAGPFQIPPHAIVRAGPSQPRISLRKRDQMPEENKICVGALLAAPACCAPCRAGRGKPGGGGRPPPLIPPQPFSWGRRPPPPQERA